MSKTSMISTTKTIISKDDLMSQKHIECPNCGYDLSPQDRICKYCGSANPFYAGGKDNLKSNNSNLSFLKSFNSNSKTEETSLNTSNVNWVVAIILLLFCFPIGVLYIVLKLFENNKS